MWKKIVMILDNTFNVCMDWDLNEKEKPPKIQKYIRTVISKEKYQTGLWLSVRNLLAILYCWSLQGSPYIRGGGGEGRGGIWGKISSTCGHYPPLTRIFQGGKLFPSRGNNFLSRRNNFPSRGNNFPSSGNNFPSRGDNFLSRGE